MKPALAKKRKSRGPSSTCPVLAFAVAAVVSVLFLRLRWGDNVLERTQESLLLMPPPPSFASLTSSLSSHQRHRHPASLDAGDNAEHLLSWSLPEGRYRIHRPEGVESFDKSSRNTVVTAHFRVKESPPSDTFYAYASHLLTIEDNMVIFTQTDLVERMKLLRSLWPTRTVIVEMLLDDVPVSALGGGGGGGGDVDDASSFWTRQLEMDPTRQQGRNEGGGAGGEEGEEKPPLLSPKLYWTALGRSWFVKEAVRMNYFDSDFFVWTDIDLFKTKKFLNKRVVRKPGVVPAGEVLWMARSVPNPPADAISTPVDDNMYHIGSMGAGSADAWTAFHGAYAATLRKFVDAGSLFVGDADAVLQAACQLHPERCSYALASDVDDVAVRASLRTVLHLGKDRDGKKFMLYRGKPGNKKRKRKKKKRLGFSFG